jgi:Uma2 family endonuclease
MAVRPDEGKWTVDRLDELPDDGQRYEVIDGLLLVTPAPVPRHQRAVGELFFVLRCAVPASMEVFVAPLDYRPTARRSLQPDVLVTRRDAVGETNLTVAPLLIAEVLSPATRARDPVLKRVVYAESGVASYWLVDPHPEKPSITVLELDADGDYRETAKVLGDQPLTVQRPFPVTIVTLALVGN